MQREEIVKKLRYAANSIPITAIDNVITEFAAQVEAMRCETCDRQAWCVAYMVMGEDALGFGCFQHEPKEKK